MGGSTAGAPRERLVVALRSADETLAAAVGDLVGWLDGELLVRPPGSAPVPAHVHLDDVGSVQAAVAGRARPPSWGSTAIAVARADAAPARPDPQVPESDLLRGVPDRPWLIPHETGELADAITARAAASTTTTIGVVGVRGGVGASVTAALLARVVAPGGRGVALLDVSGGLDVTLGIEDEPGPRWADLTAEAGPFPAATLVANLPRWGQVHVLAADARGVPGPAALTGVLPAVRRMCRAVVLDLPRSAPLDVVAHCDSVVAVTGTDAASAAGLAALLRRWEPAGVEVRLAVRRSTGAAVADAEELARWCGRPLLGELPRLAALSGDLARGLGPAARPRSGLVRAVGALASSAGLT
ncbi:hypothetical protein [Litorihabitans aurantiacus]|uniref:hypothetical protein n=1 Tax=Litorihabitans aurantiacus TaxID=1930061 RepID=UPI0024E16E26|nr:hypothetical protein [Litorihabitans aurantiacus]